MLEQFLTSHTRKVILTRLFTPDAPKYHLRQLARDGGISAPGLLKELTHFHELRLVCKEERNGRTNYYANRQSALFLVLCELVEKAEVLHEKLRRMLSNLNRLHFYLWFRGKWHCQTRQRHRHLCHRLLHPWRNQRSPFASSRPDQQGDQSNFVFT